MSDQFICISCWKEFAAGTAEIEQHGGKVVCPFCGYVQPAPAGAATPVAPPPPPVKLEGPDPSQDAVAEEIPWSSVDTGEDEDFSISEEDEHTDRIEIPPELLNLVNDPYAPPGFEDEAADERTPVESLEFLQRPGAKVMTEPSDGVMVRELEAANASKPIDWQLKTPSGLTFKFTDPEALLGWKKKLSTYKKLDVSPDGERWVDFSRFVREYEQLGNPIRAFVLASKLSDDDLPPPTPIKSMDEELDSPSAADAEVEGDKGRRSPQFTFKVKEEKSGGWGKYFAFAVIGLGLGAGIVLAVLHLTGIFVLPI